MHRAGRWRQLIICLLALWTALAAAENRISDDPVRAAREIRIPVCDTDPVVARIAVNMVPALPASSKVVDLGSGIGNILVAAVDRGTNGRVVASSAVGYELDPSLVEASLKRVRQLGLEDRITVIEQTLWDADLSDADVVFMSGHQPIMQDVEVRLLAKLKPGAYIVLMDHPLQHMRLLQETTLQLNEDLTKSCPGRRDLYSQLYLYQIPITSDPKEHRLELMGRDNAVTLRYIDLPHTVSGDGEVKAPESATVHRVEICPPHKRASCIECHLLVRDNVAIAASLNLEYYTDITHQQLVIRASVPGDSSSVELLNTIVKQEDLRQHGAHMFFYTYNLTTPLRLSKEQPERVVSIAIELATEMNPHLTYFYSLQGTEQLRDGSYDLVATPRSLGVFFTVWIQAPRVSFWVRRHGHVPPTHFEVVHNGVRVLNEVLDPGTVAGAMGFVDAIRDLSFHPAESLVLKAVFIEPAKEYRYGFAVDNWNTTIRDALIEQHERGRAVLGTVALTPSEKRRVNGTSPENGAWPEVEISLFSRFHTPSILGVRIASNQRLSGPLLLVWYVPGYSQQFLATECHPTWDPEVSGQQTVCEIYHVVVSALGGVERVEWDLWFDSFKHVAASGTSAADHPLLSWLNNGGTNFAHVAPNDVLRPKGWGLAVTGSVPQGEVIFSVPAHLVIRSHCVLCRADWYQQLFEHVSNRAPAVHYALEMAKLALYTLPTKEVPFHTDEFVHLVHYINKLRKIARQNPVDLPMKRATPLSPNEEASLSWEERQVAHTGLLQNAALSTFHMQMLQHDNSSAWFGALFPSASDFVSFVAETSAIVFPELSAFPILPQLELSLEPSGIFLSDSNNISVVASRPLQDGDRITLGCNALYHVMWLFKGRAVADRLKAGPVWEESPKGACQPSVLLRNGLILSKAKQSLDLALRFFGDRLSATAELKTYLLHATEEYHKEILAYNIQHLSP